MTIAESIILGLIQGLTEFIPISSSGHLVIAQYFMSGASDHLFLEWINIGTLLALLVYFWPKIIEIIKDITVRHRYRLLRNILLTSIPAGVVGYLSSGMIESNPLFGSVIVVAVMSAIVGVVMIVLEKLPKASALKNGEALSIPRALVIGFAQMLALIPGTSRSGATIIAGRLSGLSAKEAAEYSFLASLPIMLGVTVKVVLHDHAYFASHIDTLLIGNLVAFISGLFAVRFLMKYLANHSLAVFGWYRVALSGVIVAILLLQ